jgi:hypothetical protein
LLKWVKTPVKIWLIQNNFVYLHHNKQIRRLNMVQVVLNLEVNTDLQSVDDVVNHIDWDTLLESGDDVVEVTAVEAETFQFV